MDSHDSVKVFFFYGVSCGVYVILSKVVVFPFEASVLAQGHASSVCFAIGEEGARERYICCKPCAQEEIQV